MKRTTKLALTMAALAAAALTFAPRSEANSASISIINGAATPVFFNDGDTYRALAGPLRLRPARLGGYNTLESYGPVHQWGGFTFKEMYVLAKQATLNARRGVWACTIDPKDKDGYGRLLASCPELAKEQIEKGLAHALSIDGPSAKELIQAQRSAIVNQRGIWAKGVPPVVLTSLHSVDERLDNTGNYNRVVSPLDGYSTKWKHQELYAECQTVCHKGKAVEREQALALIARLRADAETSELVRGLEDRYLMALFDEYVTVDRVAQIFEGDGHAVMKKKLDAWKAEGAFGVLRAIDSSCMVYATFERRYRVAPKPRCLKW